ncbi:MAG: glutathione S-transferase N-terminal domain-containing protein [Solirubrobacteraceae bacterium]
MAVKLHRCSVMFIKGPHPCWRVQKALDDSGVEYEIVKHSAIRGRRTDLIERSGQKMLPVVELPDGTLVREESARLAERIRAGELGERPAA